MKWSFEVEKMRMFSVKPAVCWYCVLVRSRGGGGGGGGGGAVVSFPV